MRGKLSLICSCVLLAVSAVAQNVASCSPVGTWYGGSDVKYQLTITPITGETYAMRAEILGTLAGVGVNAWTQWSGQFIKQKSGVYLGQYISLYTTSTTFPPPPDSFEMDAVRGWMTFSDCDNMQIIYDFYGVYFDLEQVPFVDTPALAFNPGPPGETYHRMPMECPVCSTPLQLHSGGKKH